MSHCLYTCINCNKCWAPANFMDLNIHHPLLPPCFVQEVYEHAIQTQTWKYLCSSFACQGGQTFIILQICHCHSHNLSTIIRIHCSHIQNEIINEIKVFCFNFKIMLFFIYTQYSQLRALRHKMISTLDTPTPIRHGTRSLLIVLFLPKL